MEVPHINTVVSRACMWNGSWYTIFKCSFSDAHKALELLEQYRKRLDGPENEQLHEALTKAIVTIRSRLFQALLGTLLCLPTATLCNACAMLVPCNAHVCMFSQWNKS